MKMYILGHIVSPLTHIYYKEPGVFTVERSLAKVMDRDFCLQVQKAYPDLDLQIMEA